MVPRSRYGVAGQTMGRVMRVTANVAKAKWLMMNVQEGDKVVDDGCSGG